MAKAHVAPLAVALGISTIITLLGPTACRSTEGAPPPVVTSSAPRALPSAPAASSASARTLDPRTQRLLVLYTTSETIFRRYLDENGRRSRFCEFVQALPRRDKLDPWGRPLVGSCERVDPRLRSDGPDGRPDTADDLGFRLSELFGPTP